MQQKSKYSVADLVWDEDFRDWTIRPTPVSDKYWNEWLIKNPGKSEVIFTAKQMIVAVQVKEVQIKEEEIEKNISQILSNVDSNNKYSLSAGSKNKVFTFLKIAAAIILFIGIGSLLMLYLNRKQTTLNEIVSDYGNIKQVILPDNSVVILNGHSSIQFSNVLTKNQPREIWLEGEGFFNVKHLNKTAIVKPEERFLVHVKNMVVEVLGTAFDIRQRRSKTEITLNTGKIRISFTDKKWKDIIMTPGQIVTVNPDDSNYVSNAFIKPENFSAWTEKKMILTNSSVKDVLQYLEDNYGRPIVLSDTSLNSKRIAGTIMLDNLDDALFVLSKVLNITVTKTPSKIYFK